MPQVRQAQTRDAGAVLALHRAVLDEQRWFITTPEEFSLRIDLVVRRIRRMAESDNCLFLAAHDDDDELLGFLTLQGGVLLRMRHTAKLEIMVGLGARGLGVGSSLMHAAIAWAQANPVVEKLGLSVFDDNDRAIALYQRFGFEEEGRRAGEYKLAGGQLAGDVLMYRWV